MAGSGTRSVSVPGKLKAGLAAVIPGTGRRLRYRLGKDPDALGYPILDDGEVVGHFQFFDEDLLAALNVVDALVSVPRDLAWLLDGAGGLALDHTGKIALEQAVEAAGGLRGKPRAWERVSSSPRGPC